MLHNWLIIIVKVAVIMVELMDGKYVTRLVNKNRKTKKELHCQSELLQSRTI